MGACELLGTTSSDIPSHRTLACLLLEASWCIVMKLYSDDSLVTRLLSCRGTQLTGIMGSAASLRAARSRPARRRARECELCPEEFARSAGVLCDHPWTSVNLYCIETARAGKHALDACASAQRTNARKADVSSPRNRSATAARYTRPG